MQYDDGIPEFLQISQEQRNHAWKNWDSGRTTTQKLEALQNLFKCLHDAQPRKPQSSKSRPAAKQPGRKMKIIRDFLLRPEGVTYDQLTNAIGWPSISVPERARQLGLNVVTERYPETGRKLYFGYEKKLK
jgi:hypothetical protein